MMGAAWTALLCQGATVVFGWFLGTSLFPVWLPIRQVFLCGLAILPMALALAVIDFPLNSAGLLKAISVGAAVYTVSALALDVGEVRSIGLSVLRNRLRPKTPALTD
jgi:hypothetical protein